MRSFGTLYGPQWSQQKCSEQLRSSSIDWLCQMVPTGTRKLQKWSICFWNLDHCDVAVLLTAKILMFLGLEWRWNIKIRPQKIILDKKLSKNIFSVILDNFRLSPQNFVLVTFFRFCQIWWFWCQMSKVLGPPPLINLFIPIPTRFVIIFIVFYSPGVTWISREISCLCSSCWQRKSTCANFPTIRCVSAPKSILKDKLTSTFDKLTSTF